MTVRTAVATIFVCAMMFGALGTGIGYGLGAFAPGYYRSLYRTGQEPGFDPVALGTGLGLIQGTAGGAIIGLVVVAVLSWRDVRLQRAAGLAARPDEPRPPASAARRSLLLAGTLLAFGSCLASGIALGQIRGEGGAQHRRYLEERDAIAPALAADPRFASVLLHEDTAHGGVHIWGDVSTPADLERLRAAVGRAIGEGRANTVVAGVRVVNR